MKKNLVLLTGIVFVLIILLASGCSNKSEATKPPDSIVKITCKAVEAEDGSLLFSMWDENDAFFATSSSNDLLKLDNDLVTDVWAGNVVQWKWARTSQVEKFIKIAPTTTGGKVMPKQAEPAESRRVFTVKIPETAEEDDEDSYYIQFLWKGETVTIDPYLKLPRETMNE